MRAERRGHNGDIAVLDDKGRELEKYKVPYGAILKVTNGTKVRKGQALVEWDPHRIPILDLESLAATIDVHNGSDVAGLKAVLAQRLGQHDAVEFLDVRPAGRQFHDLVRRRGCEQAWGGSRAV